MTRLHGFSAAAWIALAVLSCRVVAAEDYFITTVRATKPLLNSVASLPDGSLLYSDAYGVYRTYADQTETLLSNPVQEPYCYARMFGWYCVVWLPAVYHPKPMTATADGTVYIADPEKHLIQRYDPASRTFVTVAENAGAPTVLIADDRGDLYFNDPDGCRVRRLSQGSITTLAGTGICGYTNDGGPATAAGILSVRAITLDGSGQLYIADDKAGVVRRVDRNGIIMTVAGVGRPGHGGEGTPARETPLNGPAALATDRLGNLFIADGNRIRNVGSDGLIRTIAGTGSAGHNGDAGLAMAADLTQPDCIAVASTGALRICDADRIRKLTPVSAERWALPVANANASYRYSAGSWLSVLGDYPGVTEQDWSRAIGSDGSLPTSLGGLTADVSGKAGVIAYVSPDRVDLLLPDELGASAPQTLKLAGPLTTQTFSITIAASAPEFLMRAEGWKLYPAAARVSGGWITRANPARPDEAIKLYVTGLHLNAPLAPPYDVTQPDGMQVAISSTGHAVTMARPVSPGVAELTVRLPMDLARGDHPIRVVHFGSLSTQPTFLPVGDR